MIIFKNIADTEIVPYRLYSYVQIIFTNPKSEAAAVPVQPQ